MCVYARLGMTNARTWQKKRFGIFFIVPKHSSKNAFKCDHVYEQMRLHREGFRG